MIRQALLSLAVLAGLSNAALAAPSLQFDSSPNSDARRIVNVLFADYIQARTGIQVQTATTDLDGDRVGEIIVRFIHTASCLPGMKSCRTAVVRYDQIKGWQVVLDRNVEKISILPGSARTPAPIKTDAVTWSWSFPAYRPDFSTLGKEVSLSSLPDPVVQQVAPAFGAGAAKLAAAHQGIGFDYAEPVLGDGKKALLVRMNGTGACGAANGCPLRLLVKNGASWSPVLQASVDGKVAIGPASRDGYRDIVIGTKDGAVVMGWNGQSYAVADRIEASIVEKRK
jgi:hypothetical protein